MRSETVCVHVGQKNIFSRMKAVTIDSSVHLFHEEANEVCCVSDGPGFSGAVGGQIAGYRFLSILFLFGVKRSGADETYKRAAATSPGRGVEDGFVFEFDTKQGWLEVAWFLANLGP